MISVGVIFFAYSTNLIQSQDTTMMRSLSSILLLALGSSVCNASALRGNGVDAQWIDSTALRLSFVLTEGDSVGSNYAVIATPRLVTAKGDTLMLKPTVFRGKRNMRYTERARFYDNAQQATADEVALGSEVRYDVTLRRADSPWIWEDKVYLDVAREKEGCCNVEDMAGRRMGDMVYVPQFVPALAVVEDNAGKAGELQKDNPVLMHVSQYKPYDNTRILRKEKGALYVHYPLNSSELKRDFRDNAQTLDRIVDITRSIMADSTSSVKIIQIVGLASVEGSQKNNVSLAGRRADALKAYIQKRVKISDKLFDCANGGEAWTELRDQIADGSFDGRDELLHIIDTEKNPDKREQMIRQLDGGRPYAYLRDNVLSDQRNSGYLRIYYDYVPDTAAKTINAATELMQEEKYDEALRKLLTVKDDKRAFSPLGVAYYMTGNRQKGLEYMKRAAADGNVQAKRNLEQYEAIMKAEQLKEK